MTSTYRILYVLKLVASWGIVVANLAVSSFWNMDDCATILHCLYLNLVCKDIVHHGLNIV